MPAAMCGVTTSNRESSFLCHYLIFYLEPLYSPPGAYPLGAIAHNYMLISLFVSGQARHQCPARFRSIQGRRNERICTSTR